MKKKQIKKIADKSENIGNVCNDTFLKDKKLEYAKTAISAYRSSLYANSLLIKIEKL